MDQTRTRPRVSLLQNFWDLFGPWDLELGIFCDAARRLRSRRGQSTLAATFTSRRRSSEPDSIRARVEELAGRRTLPALSDAAHEHVGGVFAGAALVEEKRERGER